MGYKSIFTVITAAATAAPQLGAAARICAANDGHLDALALAVDRSQIGYSYLGATGVLLQADIEATGAKAKELDAAARAAMAAEPASLRWSLEAVVAQSGGLMALVASRARFADLVVQSLPYGPSGGETAVAVVEAALFQAHAPVLLLPDNGTVNPAPQSIVIAWNQSAEALRAVRRALPLLKAAQRVNIAIVDPGAYGDEGSDPGGLLCQMLVRHGVHAEISVLARNLPRVAEVLARQVADQNADLLVMGAYGHSRLREALLGGTTRALLAEASVPVFMAH